MPRLPRRPPTATPPGGQPSPVPARIPLKPHLALSAERQAELEQLVAAHRTYNRIIAWLGRAPEAGAVEEVVRHDPATYDIVVRLGAAEPLWLVYDSN